MGWADVGSRLSGLGVASQSAVVGLYVWGVTVVPVAWEPGASSVAKISSVVGLLSLAGGIVAERRWGDRARKAELWLFVVTCAVAWSAAPAGLSPFRLDTARGLAGMLGWALFAFATAAPSAELAATGDRIIVEPPSVQRGSGSKRADRAYVAGAMVAAAALQLPGWQTSPPERALVVRLVGLACALALVGGAVDAALARHLARSPARPWRRWRRVAIDVAIGILLAAVGVLFGSRL